MTDPNVDRDHTSESSFQNRALDEEAVRAANAADATGFTGEFDAAGDPTAIIKAALEGEVAEHKEKYLRLYADFENFRRRAARERQEAEHRGMLNLLRGLLETIDDVARFAHVDPASTDARTIVDGVAMVERKLLKSLAGHGLEVVDPKGQPFDPALHEAITTTPAASQGEDHLVAQVFQVGYVLNGILLRPARVVVTQWNG